MHFATVVDFALPVLGQYSTDDIHTGSITPFWIKQKVDFIVTRVKIMISFRNEQNSNKRQTIG